MAEFADHFSSQAGVYAEFRPDYPTELYLWLVGLCRRREICWDVATGNGQAAVSLAKFFKSVYATDASERQISEARPAANIRYAVESAEKTSLENASIDLVTVAQAIHWFQHDKFYNEVRRVLKPGGILAAWGYGLHTIEPELDRIVQHYYSEIVGKYWPPERRYIESELKTMHFPFEAIAAPPMVIEADYSLEQLTGYLLSWSSTQRFIKVEGKNPLAFIEQDLKHAWRGAGSKNIRWPLYFRVARL